MSRRAMLNKMGLSLSCTSPWLIACCIGLGLEGHARLVMTVVTFSSVHKRDTLTKMGLIACHFGRSGPARLIRL